MKHLQYFKEMLGAANPAFAELNKNVAAEQEKRNDEAKKQRRAKIEADAK